MVNSLLVIFGEIWPNPLYYSEKAFKKGVKKAF